MSSLKTVLACSWRTPSFPWRREEEEEALHSRPWPSPSNSPKSVPTVITAVSSSPSPRVIQARISVATSTGRLDLSNCGLDEVPEQVFLLKDLVDLSLAGNNITYIQDDIQNLTSLKRLGLSGNWLSEVPSSIGQLKKLEGLWIQGNLLRCIPNEVGNLGMLRVLALTGNVLHTIPGTIGSLSCLQVLSISGNKLQELPSGLGNLNALKVLAANGNILQSLPASIKMLSSLEELSLQGNCIKKLPVDLSGLSSLKELSIADNDLTELPESIGELHRLETLSLYGNKLTQLPNDLCNLMELRRLWLEGNPLNPVHEPCILPRNLSSLGVDSLTIFPSSVHVGLGKVLKISKVTGTGLAPSFGGYFKLQQSSDVVADIVIVAFGSAPGVPNWGGLLRRVKAALKADSKSAFDVLYVVDSRRSWYTERNKVGKSWQHVVKHYEQHDYQQVAEEADLLTEYDLEEEEFAGELSSYYRQELQAAVKDYKRVVMLGDSMGASAALLFSPLATSVIAFCPQVDLAVSTIRPGRGKEWLNALKNELLDSVVASSAKITVHCGSWEHDLIQAKLLPDKVKLVVHQSDNHRLAKQLDLQGSLVNIVKQKIEEEMYAEQCLR